MAAPTKKVLWEIENEAYKPIAAPRVDGWQLLKETPTLKFYQNGAVIVVGIRGSADMTDVRADLQILTGGLANSSRYKTDLQTLKDFQRFAKPTRFTYYGVAHSLGGAIMDEFINAGLIKSGVSYNPAVDLSKFRNFPLNHRIYNSDDPLYKIMGQFTVNPEVRQNKQGVLSTLANFTPFGKLNTTLNAHKLSNFDGGGFTDWLKNAYKVITNPTQALKAMPTQVKDVLKQYGAYTVKEITVYREPIKSAIDSVLNIISFGSFNRNMVNKGYDKMFHLYAVMLLDNGTKIYTERNERVKMVINKGDHSQDNRTVKTNIRLQSIFNSALAVEGDNLWHYDAITNNCQKYITALLKYNHYLTPALDKFINQDATNLLTQTEHGVTKTVTDLASLGRNIFTGGQ